MHLRPFEIGLISFFGFIAIIGLVVLSSYQSRPSQDQLLYGDRVVIWGTLDQKTMSDFLLEASKEVDALKIVSYKQIGENTFENTLVNAIAEGKSPDLLIIPHSFLVSLRTKLASISYEKFSERVFRDTYVDGADVFTLSDGVYGVPFAVDPLVMYWNRDLFSGAGLAQPPTTWESLVAQTVPSITRRSDANKIVQSTIAFGEYANVTHAKETLAMLLLQTGNTIVEENASEYIVTLAEGANSGYMSAQAALSFYSQFALPNKDLYSWNRSQVQDREAFVTGSLALYFGMGSEWETIDRTNPNLNFDATRVPQSDGVTVPRTYGEFYAFAIPRASARAQGAYNVSLLLAGKGHAQALADALDLAPVRRDLYVGESNSPFKAMLQRSALIARGWLDPSPQETGRVFRDMIEASTAGDARVQNIILDAKDLLERLF